MSNNTYILIKVTKGEILSYDIIYSTHSEKKIIREIDEYMIHYMKNIDNKKTIRQKMPKNSSLKYIKIYGKIDKQLLTWNSIISISKNKIRGLTIYDNGKIREFGRILSDDIFFDPHLYKSFYVYNILMLKYHNIVKKKNRIHNFLRDQQVFIKYEKYSKALLKKQVKGIINKEIKSWGNNKYEDIFNECVNYANFEKNKIDNSIKLNRKKAKKIKIPEKHNYFVKEDNIVYL